MQHVWAQPHDLIDHASGVTTWNLASVGDGVPVCVTVRLDRAMDPLSLFACPMGEANGQAVTRAYWSQPKLGFSFAGVGVSHQLVLTGPQRFEHAKRVTAALSHRAVTYGPQPPFPQVPMWVGGFAFDCQQRQGRLWRHWPDCLLVLPRYLLTKVHDQAWLTVTAICRPDEVPATVAARCTQQAERLLASLAAFDASAHAVPIDAENGSAPVEFAVTPLQAEGWMQAVSEVAAQIQTGRLEKVVLARQVHWRSSLRLSWERILSVLAAKNPDCTVFAMALGRQCFVGATPELLARVAHGEVATMCLAGTAPRGQSATESRQLGQALLADPKERREHAVVAKMVQQALNRICDHVHIPPEPGLLSLGTVQHLYTPVRGKLRPGHGILDAAEQLHPTPAVGGLPLDAALATIREHEGFDRGWYAGPIGWLDCTAQGEFAVAIRSALVGEREAVLFAGCGIMGDSVPEREYRESRLKMEPMREALAASLDSDGTPWVVEEF